MVWMHVSPMEVDKPYLVKHTTQQVRATVTSILHKVDINTLAKNTSTGCNSTKSEPWLSKRTSRCSSIPTVRTV